MNLKKIEKALAGISGIIQDDMLNDKEFLVVVANMLIAYGRSGLENQNNYVGINLNDASVVETALHQEPNNVYLSSVLQGHALIKWSDNITG